MPVTLEFLRSRQWIITRRLVLIGIIGGIESFGVIGLFIGPVIMAVLLTMWREWTSAED